MFSSNAQVEESPKPLQFCNLYLEGAGNDPMKRGWTGNWRNPSDQVWEEEARRIHGDEVEHEIEYKRQNKGCDEGFSGENMFLTEDGSSSSGQYHFHQETEQRAMAIVSHGPLAAKCLDNYCPVMGISSEAVDYQNQQGSEGIVIENAVERRHKRMIKNRESAARSRARKQAYTNQLEYEVSQLKEENARLKKQKFLEAMAAATPVQPPHVLRRTYSAPV